MRAAMAGAEARRVGNLLAFTDPTGGRFVHRNQASEVLPEIFRESASYYVLGFEPAYTGTDGKFRRISVRVNRRDILLQARRGYYAPGRPAPRLPELGDDVPVALSGAVAGLWPRTNIRLAVNAAPVAVAGVRGGAVAVVVNVQYDADDARRRRPRPQMSLLVGAFDHTGRAVALDRRQLSVAPRAAGNGPPAYEVASRVIVPPGRYEIRAAVDDSTLRRAGSAYTYVDVPDFARASVSLSGMLIQAGQPEGPVPGASLADLSPVTPTARRRFARTETVTAFVREYQSAGRRFMPGYAVTEITDSSDTRVYEQQQRIEPIGEEHHPLDFRMDVPVARLAPGPYLLTFEVRHGNETARRDVRSVRKVRVTARSASDSTIEADRRSLSPSENTTLPTREIGRLLRCWPGSCTTGIPERGGRHAVHVSVHKFLTRGGTRGFGPSSRRRSIRKLQRQGRELRGADGTGARTPSGSCHAVVHRRRP